jgi:hypothetical protein
MAGVVVVRKAAILKLKPEKADSSDEKRAPVVRIEFAGVK